MYYSIAAKDFELKRFKVYESVDAAIEDNFSALAMQNQIYVNLPSEQMGDLKTEVKQYNLGNIASDIGGAYQTLTTVFFICFGACLRNWINRDMAKEIEKQDPEQRGIRAKIKNRFKLVSIYFLFDQVERSLKGVQENRDALRD